MSDLRQRAVDSVELFNAADYDGMRALLGPGFRYSETGTGLSVDTADAFLDVLRAWRTSSPDAAGEVTASAVEGDTAVLEILWTGTQTGPLPTPAGILPPSGRRFAFRATLWQRWEGERIVEERHHLDTLTMLVQLGALPAPAGV